MNLNFIFENYKYNKKLLLNYGFSYENNLFLYKKFLKNKDFFVEIMITKDVFSIKVFDSINNEEYLPFNIKDSQGAFVSQIQNEVKNITDDIIKKCFLCDNLREKILDYVKIKYKTLPEYPWEKYPTFCTLKAENNKWYGLIMNIPFNLLSKDKEGIVDIINIKLNSERIEKIIDKINYYPAYHMNKKYWISILLNSKLSYEKLTSLIDESYKLVSKK